MSVPLMQFKSIGVRAWSDHADIIRTLIVGAIALRSGLVVEGCFTEAETNPGMLVETPKQFFTPRAAASRGSP